MIHPTAIVDPKAVLAKNVEIGPYAVIGKNVEIAENIIIGSHVNIEGWTAIGDGCRIFPFASIGAPPQDLKFEGKRTELIIGNNNTIREFVTINRATLHGGGRTIIGDNNLLMAYCHVAHDCHLGNNIVMSNAATLGGHIKIEDFAIIGGLVAIHQFARVGSHAFIGGASAVTQDIPPYMTVAGNRAKLYGINTIGLKRHDFSPQILEKLKRAYKIIFRSSLIMQEALKKVREEITDSIEVDHLVEFIEESERGVCR